MWCVCVCLSVCVLVTHMSGAKTPVASAVGTRCGLEKSSDYSASDRGADCLQCSDAVGWAAGRASGL